MSFKHWILNKMNGVAGRPDLPRSPVLGSGDPPSVIRRGSRRSPIDARTTAGMSSTQHLGPYAPLVGAVRDELEHFVVSFLSLHLAIAERDRYLLTSIDVRATTPQYDELLQRFIREFKPEQIKRYLAKEVIAALPNASALDLSQFGGLNASSAELGAHEEHDYSELLAELKSADPAAGVKPFEVALIGRWSEAGPAVTAGGGVRTEGLRTPLANIDVRIEDSEGTRHLTLASPVPGRRYVIGKDSGCDVVVNGQYASRRHCEIWLERGIWWVTDAGSTNGLRVERGSHVLGRSGGEGDSAAPKVVEVVPGARIVLSAHAEGTTAQYPRLALEPRPEAARPTPIAPGPALRATPSTPIRTGELEFTVSAQMAGGARTLDLRAETLPASVGRSRTQTLVVDWAHEGVSGHHLAITAIDASGVTVDVLGDNGVILDGKPYARGAQLRWKPGEAMTLGRTIGREPECRLTLARQE
jgi:pSer/pThr/pTyr-binding forkhead associated (FHA) protein